MEYFWIKFKKYETTFKGIMKLEERRDYGVKGYCLYTDGKTLMSRPYVISYNELVDEALESDWDFSWGLSINLLNDEMLIKSLEGYVDGLLLDTY